MLVALLVLPTFTFVGPASAYPVTDTTFADGSQNATVRFGLSPTEMQGPSLRVLTNATLDGASLRLTPASTNEFANRTRTSTPEFAAASFLANLSVGVGSLSLDPASPPASRFDASNAFGGGTHIGTAVVGGRLVLGGGTSGNYTTPVLNAPAGPWGWVWASGRSSNVSDIQIDVLYANGTALQTGLASGARVAFNSGELPQLRLRLRLNASERIDPPTVDAFSIGAQVGDLATGANAQRSASGLQVENAAYLTLPQSSTLVKSGAGPVIPVVASTYRSTYISQPFILKVNGTWWLYATVNTANGITTSKFARATSPDLVTWTFGASTVMNTTGTGIEALGITHPYVVPNPTAAGFIMYYTAWASTTVFTLARATSPDGVTWTRSGQVLGPGTGWDSYGVGHPAFVGYSRTSATWLMYYSGTATSTGGGNALGLAISSDGISWTRYFGNPVLDRSVGGIDQDDLAPGKIIGLGPRVAFYYSCNSAAEYHVCLADSADGLSWTKRGAVINRSATAWESAFVSDPMPVLSDTQFNVFYAGESGSTSQIGVTTSSFLGGAFTATVDLLGNAPNLATFTKEPGNPVVPVVASTYRSAYLSQPFVMDAGAQKRMYLTVNTQPGVAGASFALASSSNLRSWTFLAAPVFNATGQGDEAYGISHPYVLADPAGRGYLMYYTAWSTMTLFQLARATSPDGGTWTRTGVVLSASGTGWESASAGHAARIVFDEAAGLFRMWYGGTATTTGGGNALGMATSPDGVNWTRYASNPVMARTGGGPDQDDAQPGKIIEIGQTLAFYYSCSSPATGYRVCAATSTNGGTTWTKIGAVINRSAANWESTFVSDPAPVALGRTLFLLYAGTGAAGSQLGLARGGADLYSPGSRLTLQDLPRAFARFQANVSAGVGVTATFGLRSSATGSVWSSTETVVADDSTLTTTLQRYLQYDIIVTPGATRTRLAGALFDFIGTQEAGSYESDALVVSDAADAVRVTGTVAGPGAVKFFASTDGGSTFVRAPNGLWVDTPGGTASLVLRADFEGRQSGPLRLDDISVQARMPGLPADVRLRAGAAGTPLTTGAGTLAAPADLTLDVVELRAAVAALWAATPAAAFVDVPLFVNSSHYGAVVLSDIVLDTHLQNPLSATFLPAGTTVSGAEGDSWTFEVQASTAGGVPLNYTWWFDGVLDASGLSTLTWTANYTSAGPHNVTAQVENGDFTMSHTWDIAVANTNRAPVLLTALPAGTDNITQSHGLGANFSVSADDPDGDVLAYAWTVDASAPPGSLDQTAIEVAGLAPGLHTVTVEARDGGGLSVARSWNLNLTNAAPTAAADPATSAAVVQSYRQVVNFSVAPQDADGDGFTFAWFVDGAVRTGATAPTFTLVGTAAGNHTVRADISDGFATLSISWDVRFTNSEPQVSTRTPSGTRGLDQAGSQNFSVTAADPDGAALTYAWSLDGALQSGAIGPTFATTDGLSPGNHTVDVVVTDSLGATSTEHWEFTVPTPAPPATTTPSFIPGPGAGLAALAIAAGAAVVAAARRRKP